MAGGSGDDATNHWDFDWGDVRGELHALGGMLGPVTFALPSGRSVQPLAVAPWSEDPASRLETLPPLLRYLRGEWPCVPFGVPDARTDLPAHWMDGVDLSTPADDAFVHGHGSNHPWSLLERGPDFLDIEIDYPDAHPVGRLSRRVRRAGPGILELTLGIEMRRDATLPIGLHPVFALPETPGNTRLVVPSAKAVRTFPVDIEAGVSTLRPDIRAKALHAVPDKLGGVCDLTSLPLHATTEELVLVELDDGEVRLENRAAGHRVTLRWDIGTFSNCLLWISNGGRRGYPWSGRFRAVGIEPIAAPFDLGQRHADNTRSPLVLEGVATAISLRADSRFETSYRLEVDET